MSWPPDALTRGDGGTPLDPAKLLELWERLDPNADADPEDKLAEAARLLATAQHVTVRSSPYVMPGETWVVQVPACLGVPGQLLVLTDPPNVDAITAAVADLRR